MEYIRGATTILLLEGEGVKILCGRGKGLMEALDKFLEQMEGAYMENSVIFRYNLNKVSVVYCRYVLYIYVSTVH